MHATRADSRTIQAKLQSQEQMVILECGDWSSVRQIKWVYEGLSALDELSDITGFSSCLELEGRSVGSHEGGCCLSYNF